MYTYIYIFELISETKFLQITLKNCQIDGFLNKLYLECPLLRVFNCLSMCSIEENTSVRLG